MFRAGSEVHRNCGGVLIMAQCGSGENVVWQLWQHSAIQLCNAAHVPEAVLEVACMAVC